MLVVILMLCIGGSRCGFIVRSLAAMLDPSAPAPFAWSFLAIAINITWLAAVVWSVAGAVRVWRRPETLRFTVLILFALIAAPVVVAKSRLLVMYARANWPMQWRILGTMTLQDVGELMPWLAMVLYVLFVVDSAAIHRVTRPGGD